MTHQEKLSKVKCKLLVREPFFGHMLSSLFLLPHKEIKKFMIYGNKVYYNIKYVESTDIDLLTNQLIHCIMHIAFLHFVRKKDRAKAAWNKSTDIAVNNILKFENGRNIDGVSDERFKGKSAENVYETVKLQSTANGYGGGFDEHMDVQDSAMEEETLRNVIEAQAVAKSAGKLPSSIERMVNDLLNPKVDWKTLVKKYVTECLSGCDYSFCNPRKSLLPYGIYCASLVEEPDTMKSLVIATDTSGSITDKILEKFFAEIKFLHHLAETTKVITCDAVVHDVYTLNIHDTIKDMKFKGGGGTDFRPVFDYLKKAGIRPTLLVFLTDGWGSYPEKEPGYPVIWTLIEKYDGIPWGKSIYLEGITDD